MLLIFLIFSISRLYFCSDGSKNISSNIDRIGTSFFGRRTKIENVDLLVINLRYPIFGCKRTDIKHTGWPKSKFPFLRAITQKLSISDPKLVIPKCVWEAVVFFNFRKFVYIFQLFVYNFSKKTTASQTHFGFTNLGLELLSFWVIALRKGEFWFGSPCTYVIYIMYLLL